MTVKTTNEPARLTCPTHSCVTELMSRADTFTDAMWYPFPNPAQQTSDPSFETERTAFQAMLPMLLARYPGEFVAVMGGNVVDHDRSRRTLMRRFFGEKGDVAVYLGYVGPARAARQISPLRRRRA